MFLKGSARLSSPKVQYSVAIIFRVIIELTIIIPLILTVSFINMK